MMLSFILPAYNEELELPGALRSIKDAGAACGHAFEIIVVNDASTDATATIAAAEGARVINVSKRQIAAVRNAGAREARGDIFFFVDADTQINAATVATALHALDAGCIGGSARLRFDRKVPLWAGLTASVFCAVYFAAKLGVGAFIFTRRADFEAVGGFDEQYFAGEEMYLTLALRKRGLFIILREPVVTSARKVRMHSGVHLFRQWLGMVRGGQSALRGRKHLDVWYDGKRERAS